MRILGIATTCILVAVANANAVLLELDWNVAGDKAITRDTDSGLEWLDLTESLNRSFNDVSGQFGGGGDFDGFRHATANEVFVFFTHAGIPVIDTVQGSTTPSALNLPSVPDLQSLWGVTGVFGPQTSSFGITADFPSAGNVSAAVLITEPEIPTVGRASTRGTDGPVTLASPTAGHALVRNVVPEPSAFVLGALGFAGLAARGWRRRRGP